MKIRILVKILNFARTQLRDLQSFFGTKGLVENLACLSCLGTIEMKLKRVPGMVGLTADLQTSTILADHGSKLASRHIANYLISIGYPAKVISAEKVDSKDAAHFVNKPYARCGTGGCTTTGNCNTTANAWRELLRKFTKN